MRLRSVICLSFCIVLFSQGCASPQPPENSFGGSTMGTTYNIIYPAGKGIKGPLKTSVDSLLHHINISLSTYIDSSLISKLNRSQAGEIFSVDQHFSRVYAGAVEIYRSTNGAFNPAVGPLVTAWGFGARKTQNLLISNVDSLLKLIKFEAFNLDAESHTISKTLSNIQLDFSAIAKGYGVDAVAELLESRGIKNYFVEIGGEVRTRGLHPSGKRGWFLGIDVPSVDNFEERKFQMAFEIQDIALATSGNYRNFYIKNGKRYVHTINPITGYPEESDLLSASVIANDCMTADAYATAFMVMGKEKALEMAEKLKTIEAYFITSDTLGNYQETRTSGFPLNLTAKE